MTRQSDDGRPIGGTAPSRTDPPDADRIPAAIWRVALVTAIGAVMTGLDTSVVNVGLASVGHALGASLTAAQWINSGYLLALAAALPACGWLSNQIGAGRLWLQSLVAFTVLSALCALAPDISTLIIARVLQGLSGGVLIPAGMAILGQTAGRKRMGRVVTIASVPSILAPAVGPVVGALLISAASWRWLFFINVPVGIAGAVLGMRVVPRGARDRGGRLDAISLALAGLGLPAVSYAITEATVAHSILSPAALVPLVAGLVALALFGRRCLGADKPLMDLRLAQNKIFASAAVEVLFAGAALFGGLIVMPLYFQIGFRQGVVHTGLLLMPFSLGAAATFPVAGWLTDRYGGGVISLAGCVLATAVTALMAMLSTGTSLLVVGILQVLRGVAMALAGPPGSSTALAAAEPHQMPDASAQVNILSRVGGAIGSAVLVVLLSDSLARSGVADAFRVTFWWLAGTTLLALAGAGSLAWQQRSVRTEPVTEGTH